MITMYGTTKELIQRLLDLDNQKEFLITIKEPKSKRSLEQNRLLWKLIHLLAKETQQDDMDVYCGALERADAKSDYIITQTEMADALRKTFRGVKFIRIQEVNGKDRYIYKVYLGSSKMNTKEMGELLDIVIQLCAEHGVDIREEYYG